MSKPSSLGQTPLTPAVFHILLALADGPLHGYAVMQAVDASAGDDARMGPGTIYGSLQRMEDAGLVKELTHAHRRSPARVRASSRRAAARWPPKRSG